MGPEGSPWDIKVWGLLLTMFFSEHIFLGVQKGVRTALGKIDSPGLQKERAERFSVRKYVFSFLYSHFAKKALTIFPQTIPPRVPRARSR